MTVEESALARFIFSHFQNVEIALDKITKDLLNCQSWLFPPVPAIFDLLTTPSFLPVLSSLGFELLYSSGSLSWSDENYSLDIFIDFHCLCFPQRFILRNFFSHSKNLFWAIWPTLVQLNNIYIPMTHNSVCNTDRRQF